MWDPLEEPDDDWEPLRSRRRGPLRILAIVVVAAMILAIVVPVVLRILSEPSDPPPSRGVQAGIVAPEVLHP